MKMKNAFLTNNTCLLPCDGHNATYKLVPLNFVAISIVTIENFKLEIFRCFFLF